MPRRLLLDGSDLESLMARVRTELGPQARIIKAERVRSGGIGGFFAREYFELTVEVPDDVVVPGDISDARGMRGGAGSGTAGSGAGSGATGIDALLDAADAADADGASPEGGTGTGSAAEVPSWREAEPVLSTTGDSFAAVLDSVRQLAAGPDLVAEATDVVGKPSGATPAPVGAEPSPGKSEPVTDVGRPEFTALQPTVVTRHRGATAAELARIGIPKGVIRAVQGRTGDATRFTLSQVLSNVPRAPQILSRPGAVIVVAGIDGVVAPAAHAIAQRLGLDETQIALAGEFSAGTGRGQWVTNAVAAQRLRQEATRTGVPLLVSLTVGTGRFRDAEAADLVAALAPDQLWAAVEADRAVEDTMRWLAVIGEQRAFDAIAAQRVQVTSSPGRILEFGIPVGLIDGLVASAPVWAAVLSEQLDEPVWD